MATMNLLVFLNAYSDKKPSNSPRLSNIKWSRDLTGLSVSNPSSQEYTLAASGAATLSNKKFVYIESSEELELTINGGDPITIKPFVVNTTTFPGVFMLHAEITSLVITNPSSTEEASVIVHSAE
jgi:hypothetical protein